MNAHLRWTRTPTRNRQTDDDAVSIMEQDYVAVHVAQYVPVEEIRYARMVVHRAVCLYAPKQQEESCILSSR